MASGGGAPELPAHARADPAQDGGPRITIVSTMGVSMKPGHAALTPMPRSG
jgi:hypothetical protein